MSLKEKRKFKIIIFSIEKKINLKIKNFFFGKIKNYFKEETSKRENYISKIGLCFLLFDLFKKKKLFCFVKIKKNFLDKRKENLFLKLDFILEKKKKNNFKKFFEILVFFKDFDIFNKNYNNIKEKEYEDLNDDYFEEFLEKDFFLSIKPVYFKSFKKIDFIEKKICEKLFEENLKNLDYNVV